jgi:hypothetical protein
MIGKISIGFVGNPSKTAIGVYVGRGTKNPSPLRNPYPITAHRSRNEACDQYEEYLMNQMNSGDKVILTELNRIGKLILDGKDVELLCYCSHKGLRCHGMFIKSVIDEKILDLQVELADK